MIRRTLLLLSALAVAAQEPTKIGMNLRLSRPGDNLKDMVGDKTGWGISLDAESDMYEAWKGRLVLGFDSWGPGDAAGQSGVRGKATLGQVSLEAVRMLGPEGPKGYLGPFVVIGLGAYGWNITGTSQTDDLAVTHRVIHVGGSLGLGYRFSKSIDAELRVSGGKVEPEFTATIVSFGVTYRY